MTKQELINFIDERIEHMERVKAEYFQRGDKVSTKYFDGQCGVYKQLRIFVEDLEEPLINPYIRVKTLRYDPLSLGCGEYTKTFKGLIDFTLWLRYVQFKMPDLILSEVSYVNKKEG